MTIEKAHLIMLHGALGSAIQLEPTGKQLADAFQIHTLNFSGHGGSQIPQQGFSIELFVEDVLSFLKNRQIQSAHFFGYSMGGYVVLALAGKHPERVKSVFTLATKFDWNPTSAKKEAGMLNPEIILQKIPAFAAKIENLHAPADWKQIMTATADMMIRLGDSPLGKTEFADIICPVKLAVGDSDKMVTREETYAVAEMITGAEVMVLPNTPHPLESCDVKLLSDEIRLFIST